MLFEPVAAVLGWILKRLPIVIIAGMAAFLPNFRTLIEGGDEPKTKKARVIVALAMVAGFAVSAFLDL